MSDRIATGTVAHLISSVRCISHAFFLFRYLRLHFTRAQNFTWHFTQKNPEPQRQCRRKT